MDSSIVVILVVFGIIVLLYMNQNNKTDKINSPAPSHSPSPSMQPKQQQVYSSHATQQMHQQMQQQMQQQTQQPMQQPMQQQQIQQQIQQQMQQPMSDPRQIVMDRLKPTSAMPYQYTGDEPDGIMTDDGAMYSGSLDDDQLKIMDDPTLKPGYRPEIGCSTGQCQDDQCMVPGSISERCMWNKQTR